MAIQFKLELIISDGFTNSLSNSEIEFNFINNLKDFHITENLFKRILFNKSELSSSLIYFLFFVNIINSFIHILQLIIIL